MRLAVRPRTILSSAAAALAAAALCAAPASADETTSASGCPDVPTVQAFAPWQDEAQYFLAPDGDIEAGAGTWILEDGAAAVEGDATSQVGAASDHMSLQLPGGSSATTAAMCIAAEHRTLRLFAAGPAAGKLFVNALVTMRSGNVRRIRIGALEGTGSWAPSPIVDIRVNEWADTFGGALSVALQFVARNNETWQIDDVYVDPYRMH